MDLTFFGTDEENVILELVEVEAHTACETILEGLLLFLTHILAIINNKFEFDNLLSFKFVLHKMPVSYPAIT